MKRAHSISMKDTGIIINVSLGILLTMVCAFLLSILLTVLVENERIQISGISVCLYGIHAISVFIGTLLSLTLEKERLAIIAGIVAAAYFVILISINMLVFSSGFEGVIGTAAGILAGCALSVLLKVKQSAGKRHKVKLRSR